MLGARHIPLFEPSGCAISRSETHFIGQQSLFPFRLRAPVCNRRLTSDPWTVRGTALIRLNAQLRKRYRAIHYTSNSYLFSDTAPLWT